MKNWAYHRLRRGNLDFWLEKAYTNNGEYPEVFGQYEDDNYPQIPCLVEDLGFFGIRYFNITEQCWDDEEADDYFFFFF